MTPRRGLAAALFGGLVAALFIPGIAVASPGVPNDPSVPAGLGTGRYIVLRPARADLVENRRVVRSVPMPSGAVSLNTVIRAIGDARYAVIGGTTATMNAPLLQRPRTTLLVQSPLRTVDLVDTAAAPAYLAGSSATVTFAGVTVRGVLPGGAPAPAADHRPYLRYSASTVTAADSTFANLGTPTSAQRCGLSLGDKATLSATGVSFTGSGCGLDATGDSKVTLRTVTAAGNTVGVALVGGTVAVDTLTVADNGTGLRLRGPYRAVALATVAANHNGVGVAVSELGTAPLGPLTTARNTITGVALTGCPGCVLTGVNGTGDAVGVRLDEASTGAALRGSTLRAVRVGVEVSAPGAVLTGVVTAMAAGGTGVLLHGPADRAQLTGGSASGGALGVSVDAAHARIVGITVVAAELGLRLGATSADTTVQAVSVTGAQTALAVDAQAGTARVDALTVHQSGGVGLRSGAADLLVTGSLIEGAAVGLDLDGHAVLRDSRVTGATEAVRAGRHADVLLDRTVLAASVLGLRVAPSGHVTLNDCSVSAPLGARGTVHLSGDTHFPALPLRWFGVFALVALAFAAGLELWRRLRERGHRHYVNAPAHVTNVA